MFIKRISLVFILAVIFTLLFPASALAVPQVPHQFYGEVTIGGEAATDGLLVEAKIDDITYGTSTTHGGVYGLNYDSVINLMQVVADDPDTPEIEGGAPGDTIEFYVDGVKAEEEYTFARGGYTELDLTVVETVPPEVVSTSPADTAIDVAVDATVSATFSEAMDSATITAASFTLSDGGAVSGAVGYNPATLTATFAPDADLGYSTAYTATITTAVTDLAENPLAAVYSWGFTTVDLVEPATVTVAVVAAWDPLTEENLDGSQITATVAEDTYVDPIAVGDFTLTAPAGTTVASVERTSGTVATLTLAFDGTDFNVDDTLGVTVAADALTTSTEAVVSENTLPITATEESAPVASFEVSTTVAVVDEMVVFTDTSESADSWLWDFGDDTTTSIEQNPTHAYAEKGIYEVTLTVTNILGSDTTNPQAYIIVVVPAIAGEPGADGAAGATGDTGTAGATGDTGTAGTAGATGDTGAAGAPGAAGAQGEQGVAGAPGAAGAQGESGGEASKALPIVALVLAIAALLGVGITILRKA